MIINDKYLSNSILFIFLFSASIIGSRAYLLLSIFLGVLLIVIAAIKNEKISFIPSICFALLILSSSFLPLLGYYGDGVFLNSATSIFYTVAVVFIAVLIGSISTNSLKLMGVVRALITFITSTLAIQYAYSEVFNSYIPISNILGIGESRHLDYSCIFDCAIRPTSYQIEPSAITSTIVALWVLGQVQGEKKIIFSLMAIFGCVISFSTMGYVQATLISFFVLYKYYKDNFFKMLAFFSILGFILVIFLEANSDNLILKFLSSISIRLNLLNQFIDQSQSIYGLFGYGYLNFNQELFLLAESESKFRTSAVNDLGLIFYLFFRFGFFGIILLIIFIARGLTFKRMLLILPLLTIKYSSSQLLGIFVLIKFLRSK